MPGASLKRFVTVKFRKAIFCKCLVLCSRVVYGLLHVTTATPGASSQLASKPFEYNVDSHASKAVHAVTVCFPTRILFRPTHAGAPSRGPVCECCARSGPARQDRIRRRAEEQIPSGDHRLRLCF